MNCNGTIASTNGYKLKKKHYIISCEMTVRKTKLVCYKFNLKKKLNLVPNAIAIYGEGKTNHATEPTRQQVHAIDDLKIKTR